MVEWDDGDPPWVRALGAAVTATPSRAPTLALIRAIREVDEWTQLATVETWKKRTNRTALACDLRAAAAGVGPELGAMLGRALSDFVGEVSGPFCARRTGLAEIAAVSGTALIAALTSAAAVRAAWTDLVGAAIDGDDEAMVWGTTCLESQLAARGFDGPRDLESALLALSGRHAIGGLGPIPSLELRILRAGEALAREHEARRCVAWLTYDHAMPEDFVASFGPITFLDADWCLPNAIRHDGQRFAHRDEVRALVDEGIDWDFDGENWKPDRSRRPYLALARVDLGERAVTGALERAAELVQLMLDVARLRGGGRPWRHIGPSILVVDGQATEHWQNHSEPAPSEPSDAYSRRAFTQSLAEHGPLVGDLLSGAIPPDLAEAIRMLGEAGQADDPWRQPGQQRTIDQRTVLVLHDSAHDHLATFARCASSELDARIREDWPTSRWSQELTRAIDECLSWAPDGDMSLELSIRKGRTYQLAAASDHRDELLAAAQNDHSRRSAARWLSSVDDAAAHRALLATLAAQCELLAARTQRVRNGIAHGTPPSAEVTASVMGYSRFRAFRALYYAMEAVTTGRTMRQVLDEYESANRALSAALEAGISQRQQWA